jgi:hypothetical protein
VQVSPTTTCPRDEPQGFGNWDVGQSARTTGSDDSALRKCHESLGTRYSERHSAHNDATSKVRIFRQDLALRRRVVVVSVLMVMLGASVRRVFTVRVVA